MGLWETGIQLLDKYVTQAITVNTSGTIADKLKFALTGLTSPLAAAYLPTTTSTKATKKKATKKKATKKKATKKKKR